MKRIVFILIIVCLIPSCGVFYHDQQAAARAASEFAQAGIVERDYAKDHRFLTSSTAEQCSVVQLSEIIINQHPKAFLVEVKATEYEMMPGQRGMMI